VMWRLRKNFEAKVKKLEVNCRVKDVIDLFLLLFFSFFFFFGEILTKSMCQETRCYFGITVFATESCDISTMCFP
jgi:hypothetical protein